MTAKKRTSHPGVEVRHRRTCREPHGGRCNCTPSYRAMAWSAEDGKKIQRTFRTLASAKAWRQDQQVAIRRGVVRASSGITVGEAASDLIEGMRSGVVRTNRGTPYKPAVTRDYARSIRLRLGPAFGTRRLTDLRRSHVQTFVDALVAEGLDGSTVKNALCPLRVIYRRAVQRDLVAVNPCNGLDLPAPSGKRERIAPPEEAARLLAALPAEDRALWACAMYGGLRRGELRALRWTDVDLAAGRIHVSRGWDDKEGEQAAKTAAARRTVPVAGMLRDYLLEHRLDSTGDADSLVFGHGSQPFDPPTVRRAALAAWKAANAEATKKAEEDGREVDRDEMLTPIGLHESRHTFASLMIAAGVNIKAISTYVGHSSVATTLDIYGHLLPNAEAEAASKLDALLARDVCGEVVGKSDPVGSVPERS